MDITVLGNNSALPNHDRFPTAQVLQVSNGENYLIDCGEGTQVRLQRHSVRISRISKIFISHLHGDHYFGLIGLLTRLNLNNHPHPVELYAPKMLLDIINIQLQASHTTLVYPLHFHPLEAGRSDRLLVDNESIQVRYFPTEHRIECYGFTFTRKASKKRKIRTEACECYRVPLEHYRLIAEGEDYSAPDGRIIPNHELTYAPPGPRKYSYCADTRYSESFLDDIMDSDWLYHETTYLSEETALAYSRFHSTTADAARIAGLSRSKKLLIGHFSSKYKYLDQFLHECRSLFPETYLSYEGQNIQL